MNLTRVLYKFWVKCCKKSQKYKSTGTTAKQREGNIKIITLASLELNKGENNLNVKEMTLMSNNRNMFIISNFYPTFEQQ